MPRVTAEEVFEILDTTLEVDQITACITAANLTVTNVPGACTDPVLGDDELKEIERWLAAHLACIRDPREIRTKIGDAESWFAPNVTTAWARGLSFTSYGQQVLWLDRTGTIAALGEKRGKFRAGPRENSSRFNSDLT